MRRASPLLAPGSRSLPKYFTLRDVSVENLGSDGRAARPPSAERVAELIAGLNARGYWPTPMTNTSNPYIGAAPLAVTGGEYQTTNVGDIHDTSPYRTDYPVEVISTATFVRNMGELIGGLATVGR